MPPTQPKPIKILSATYGVLDDASAVADVTARVQALLPNPPMTLNIPKVDNTVLGGDPAPGRAKELKVRYNTGAAGAVLEKRAAEGASLTINVAPPPAAAAPRKSNKPRVGGTPVPYQPSRKHAVQPIVWESKEGKLWANGTQFKLKGVNYFGCETHTRYPHGLWKLKVKDVLDFIVGNGFNAIRLPFSLAMALDLGKVNTEWIEDADLRNLPCGVLFSKFIDRCAERGVLVMLDLHRLDEQQIPELWYDNDYSECELLQGWDNILDLCKDKWNVFACDLKNEPHGDACWGTKNVEKDWNTAAEKIANHILRNHPEFKGLFFIEGVNRQENLGVDKSLVCPHSAWWGGRFEGLHQHPIRLEDPAANNRIVYSPHVYGPSVYMQDYFKAKDFPKNMPAIWQAHWGFAKDLTGSAVVLGEWGGWMNTKEDKAWQEALADFLIAQGFTDQFYWCLNPDSGDTGGLVEEDWVTPVKPKLALLAKVQPKPSKVQVSGGKVTIANSA